MVCVCVGGGGGGGAACPGDEDLLGTSHSKKRIQVASVQMHGV